MNTLNYIYVLNEEKGISVNTKPTIDYIKKLCKQSINAAYHDSFDYWLKVYPIAKPGKRLNTQENCIDYFFLYDLPKVQDTLVWLSNLSTIMIICRKYQNKNHLKQNLNKRPSLSSIFLTDDNTMKDFMSLADYDFLSQYIPQVIPNYTDSSYTGTKNSIAHLNINFSFLSDNIYENLYCGNLLINIKDLSELDSIIQHELNHIHKSKSIYTDEYLSSYKEMLNLRTKENPVITDFVNIAYHCIPDECNAFVEQCYKEYILEANRTRSAPERAFKHLFIPEEDRLEMIKNTPTYKKIITTKRNILIYKQEYLQDKQNIQAIKNKLFFYIENIFKITKRNNESDLNYILRVLKFFSEKIDKTLKKCERTIYVSESYKAITLDDLCI